MMLTFCVVECDRCGNRVEREQSSRGSKTSLVRELRRQGWRFGRELLCPRCVEEESSERADWREEAKVSRWHEAERRRHSGRFLVRRDDGYSAFADLYGYSSLPYARRRARSMSRQAPADRFWISDRQTDRDLGSYLAGTWLPAEE